MDSNRSIYNLAIHKHPLFPSARFFLGECAGCHVKEHIYGGYICNEPCCYGWFHKECAEAPPEINHHPSHLEHPLLLTNDSQPKDSPCDCCGKDLLSPCYTCPTCEFKVDLICGMKPSPPAIEHPMCHDHSLVFLKKREVEVPCEACKESIDGPSYSCLECIHVYFHLDCVHLSKEMYHPCHPSHPLEVAENPRRVVIFVQLNQRCFIIVLFAISVCALVVLNIHHLLLLRIPRLTSTHLVFLQAKSRLLASVVELKATTLNLIYVSSAILSSMEIVSAFLAS